MLGLPSVADYERSGDEGLIGVSLYVHGRINNTTRQTCPGYPARESWASRRAVSTKESFASVPTPNPQRSCQSPYVYIRAGPIRHGKHRMKQCAKAKHGLKGTIGEPKEEDKRRLTNGRRRIRKLPRALDDPNGWQLPITSVRRQPGLGPGLFLA